MPRQSLLSNLVGKWLVPSEQLLRQEHLTGSLWGLKPNSSGMYFAEIVAVWTEEQCLRVQLRGPNGDTKKLYLMDGMHEIFNTLQDLPQRKAGWQ
jgi:hypothetical protein